MAQPARTQSAELNEAVLNIKLLAMPCLECVPPGAVPKLLTLPSVFPAPPASLRSMVVCSGKWV